MNGVSAYAQGSGNQSPEASISTYDDCTEINIQYQFDETLTREEFINSMDAAFFESLNKFDACQASLMGSSAAPSGGAGGLGENAGDGSSGGASATTATSSSELSGTEPAISISTSTSATTATVSNQEGLSGKQPAKWNNPDANNGRVSSYRKATQSGRGKTPEDIPPADNDSVLEAQIRQAAENETDPEIKKKLWDEYRKYKGLPQAGN